MAPLSSRPSTTDEIAAVGEAPTFTPSPDTGTPSAPAPSPPAPAPAPAPSPIQIDTTTGLPTNVPTTVSQGSSIPWGTIVAVGVGVVALGAVALSVKSSQVRGNPAMYGPRVARVYLEREYLDRGGYTRRGRYFGVGAPLYLYTGEGLVDKNGSVHDYVHDWVRAADRKSAMQKIRERFPNVRFSGAL